MVKDLGFKTASRSYDTNSRIQIAASAGLAQLVCRRRSGHNIKKILDIGAGTGTTSEALIKSGINAEFTLLDLSKEMLETARSKVANIKELIVADAEMYDLKDNYDLIVSSFSMQWFSDLDKFFEKISRHAQLFAFTIPITNSFRNYRNLFEARGVSWPGLEFRTPHDVLKSVSNHFEIIDSFEKTYIETFHSGIDIIRYFKNIGAYDSNRSKTATFLKWHKEPIELNYDVLFVIASTKTQIT